MFLLGMTDLGFCGPPGALLTPFESPDGFCGTVDLLGGVGDGGRLEKLWLVGVIGVLEGRSMGAV